MSASPQLWDQWANLAFAHGFFEDLLPTIGKRPFTKNWTKTNATEQDLQSWRQANYNIGIRASYLRAIDIDVPDDALATQIVAFIRMRYPMPIRYRAGTGKCLLAFCMQGSFDKLSFKTIGGSVEFLANKQQFIVAGTHPDSSEYQWQGGLPDTFPELSQTDFESLWQELQTNFGIATETDSLKPIIERQITDDVADYLRQNNLIVKEDAGRLHLTHCPWEDEHTDKQTLPTQTTYFVAHTEGYAYGAFKCMHEHCKNRTLEDFKLASGYIESDFEVAPLTPENLNQNDKLSPEIRFKPIQAAAFVDRQEPEWLIDDILPQAQFGLLFGASGTYKTFAALDLALSIATGRKWNGRDTKQGTVAYICGEGVNGVRMRVKAWARQHNYELKDIPFHIIEEAPNLLEKKDVGDLLKAIEPLGPLALIFIDTLAQSTPGGDENSGKDMTRALSHCRALNTKTGGMVMVVHHAGKDLTRGARGWSGLKAAADVEFEMSAIGPMCSSFTVSKQKDGETGLAWTVRMQRIELGLNRKGKEISTLFPLYTEGTPKQLKPKRPNFWRQTVLEVFDGLGGTRELTETVILEAMRRAPDHVENHRRRFFADRAIKELALSGDFKILDGVISREL